MKTTPAACIDGAPDRSIGGEWNHPRRGQVRLLTEVSTQAPEEDLGSLNLYGATGQEASQSHSDVNEKPPTPDTGR
ncbi:hypothetical protein VB739_04295 [Cyanobium gracile UHCC 0281]|uniref:Uncharacterized protein n=1 Tax=Cyanobium gracile UHCC 0281 TaxID=3110309 RepID=A0ABU5STU8_9CYAN|nr:hypothetical protein [Cyanobium gracile UHCC 0281]